MEIIERAKLIPYCEIDGIRTFSDSYIKSLFQRMVRDQSVESAFIDGTVTNEDMFLSEMRNSLCFITVLDNDYTSPVAVQWLNRPQHRWMQHHVVVFSEFWHDPIIPILGRNNMSRFLHMTTDNGQYMFDALIGIISVNNIAVFKLGEKIGMNKTGYIPNGVWNAYKNQSEDAYLLTYTREGNTNESL